jgi:hypothetical protein
MAGPYGNKLEPNKRQFVLPGDGQPWMGLNRYDLYSRWAIADTEFDDLVNFYPQGGIMRQVPASGGTIATLAATVVWMSAQLLNGGVFIFCLCSDNNIYQVSTGGSVTQINGATSISVNADIANWQGTTILISDVNAAKVYSWNGTTFATVFTGQPASFIKVFSGRLWMANGNTVTFTRAGTFNSLTGDSGAFAITDEDCTNPVLGMLPFGGQFYLFGSNYCQVISNLYDSGTPSQLQFTKYTLESQIAPLSRWSLLPYGAQLYFANNMGIWTLQGAIPQLVSDQLGGFFQVLQTGTTLSAGLTQIYSDICAFWHMKTGAGEHTLLGLTKDMQWFRCTFGTITFITSTVSSAITGNLPTLWGTDGTHIFQLFASPNSNVTSTVQTKLWSFGNPLFYKVMHKLAIFNVITGAATVRVNHQDESGNTVVSSTQSFSPTAITWQNDALATVSWVNNSSATVSWVGSIAAQYTPWQFDVPFRCRSYGLNIQITGMGSTLLSLVAEVEESQAGWGS